MLTDVAKHFLRTWLVPPGFVALRHLWQQRPFASFQKFWAGEPVPAPPRESAYFAALGLSAETRTRQDDSRPGALIARTVRLPLPPAASGQACELAILGDGPWFESQNVTLRVGGAAMQLSHLSNRAWLDVRLDVPPGADFVEIETDAPIFVTPPSAVQLTPVTGDAGRAKPVRHIVVLVLDGWSVRMAGIEHPTEPAMPLTPNIDGFFLGGLKSDRAVSSGEWTLPTVASFFTGLGTLRHQVFRPLEKTMLPADRELLAEKFQRAGFHTLGLSPANRVTPAYGHHRGFDRFVYHSPQPGQTTRMYDPAVWVADVVGHLDVHQHDRTFTYMHLPDTHPAWHVPPLTRAFNLQRRGTSTGLDLSALERSSFGQEQGRQVHLLRLHELDRMLAGLFNFITEQLSENAVVVLTADHGTPWHLLREVRPADEPRLVDDRTSIIFRMRGTGVPDRNLESLTAPNLDLMPTLLKLAGLDVPDDLDGGDLLAFNYRRDHVVQESVFEGVYEVSVRDGARAYFERHPFDQATGRLTGPRFYERLFTQGTADYSDPLDEPAGHLRDIAHQHMKRVGLLS